MSFLKVQHVHSPSALKRSIQSETRATADTFWLMFEYKHFCRWLDCNHRLVSTALRLSVNQALIIHYVQWNFHSRQFFREYNTSFLKDNTHQYKIVRCHYIWRCPFEWNSCQRGFYRKLNCTKDILLISYPWGHLPLPHRRGSILYTCTSLISSRIRFFTLRANLAYDRSPWQH
jgi:hypothetical protein